MDGCKQACVRPHFGVKQGFLPVVFPAKSEIVHFNSRGDSVPVSEHHLTDRPHTMLRLTKASALPASVYACQIWGTRYMKEGAEMDSPLQTVHLCLLKRILGVKRTTPHWSVLRERGHEPLQF
eukprot:773686-Pelagomonas_calceolata.AAC.1